MQDLAIQYVSLSEVQILGVNFLVFILGAIVAAFTMKVETGIRRVIYLLIIGGLTAILAVSQLAWTTVTPLPDSNISVIFTFSMIMMIGFGFFYYLAAMARSVDATGTTSKAFLAFIPLANLWLLGTPGKNRSEEASQRNWASKYLLDPVLVMFGLLLFGSNKAVEQYFESLPERQEPLIETTAGESSEPFLKSIVSELKASVPRRIDEITILTGISYEGKTLIYQYSVETDMDEFVPGFAASVTKNICRPQALGNQVSSGLIVVEAMYRRASDRKILMDHFIRKGDCGI